MKGLLFFLLMLNTSYIQIDFSNLKQWTNKVFYPLIFDNSRYIVMLGGAGSGKSHFQAQKLVYKMIIEPGHNILVVRKTARTNRYSTFALIKRIISDFGFNDGFKINEGDMSITNLTNGNKMVFAGLDDTEKLKSITFEKGLLTDIWIEEASECDKKDFLALDLRLRGLSAVSFQITLTFNPISDQHWIKGHFFDPYNLDNIPIGKMVGTEDFTLLRTTYKQNRFLDDHYKKTLNDLQEIDRTYYEIYALGEWGVFGDLVFSNYKIYDFETDLHYEQIITGMDFGFNHNYAIEKIGLKNNGMDLFFFNELYLKEHTTAEVIEINKKEGVLLKQDLCTADSADPSSIKEWVNSGYEVRAARKGKDSVKAGYSFLKSRTLHIHSSCVGMASEIKTLKYKKDKEGNSTDEIVGYRDDAFAAARYATEQIWSEDRAGMALINPAAIGL